MAQSSLGLARAAGQKEAVPVRIGVCSWSLRPKSIEDLAELVAQCGVNGVQLALDPIRTGQTGWDEGQIRRVLDAAGIEIFSGMMGTAGEDYSTLETIKLTGGVRPDEHWDANLGAAAANADLASRLGMGLVTFHAGFIPHEAADPLREVMIDRLRQIVDVFGGVGVEVAFETGQETAATLLDALAALERPGAGVNFDPANMNLYGMGDPVEALEKLAGDVKQIHIKDAVLAPEPGTWGSEEAVGEGAVDWDGFFGVVRKVGLACDCVIEREDGESRVEDVIKARSLVERLCSL